MTPGDQRSLVSPTANGRPYHRRASIIAAALIVPMLAASCGLRGDPSASDPIGARTHSLPAPAVDTPAVLDPRDLSDSATPPSPPEQRAYESKQPRSRTSATDRGQERQPLVAYGSEHGTCENAPAGDLALLSVFFRQRPPKGAPHRYTERTWPHADAVRRMEQVGIDTHVIERQVDTWDGFTTLAGSVGDLLQPAIALNADLARESGPWSHVYLSCESVSKLRAPTFYLVAAQSAAADPLIKRTGGMERRKKTYKFGEDRHHWVFATTGKMFERMAVYLDDPEVLYVHPHFEEYYNVPDCSINPC